MRASAVTSCRWRHWCRLSQRLSDCTASSIPSPLTPDARHFTAAPGVARISCRWATSPFSRSSKVGELRPIERGVARRTACSRLSIGLCPATLVVRPSSLSRGDRLASANLVADSCDAARRCVHTWLSRWITRHTAQLPYERLHWHDRLWRSQRLCVAADPSAGGTRVEAPKAPSRVGSAKKCPVPGRLGGLESVVSSPSTVRPRKRIFCIF